MVQMTLKIDGMQCGMCESHVNDTLRAAFPLKKVRERVKKEFFTSSQTRPVSL